MRLLLFLPLTGCLAGTTAAGSGDLLITEYANANPGTDRLTFVELGNPTDAALDLSDYTLGIDLDEPSTPLSGLLEPGDVYLVEIGDDDFFSVTNRSPDLTLPARFGFTPDEIRLYLADGSGFEGSSVSRNDATFQDTISRNATGSSRLSNIHMCRRGGVVRGRGQFDETEWTLTETFAMDANELNAVATTGDLGCP